jgi:hypothetical protein
MPSDIDAFKISLEKLIKTQAPSLLGQPGQKSLFKLEIPPDLPTPPLTLGTGDMDRVSKLVRNSFGIEIQSRNTNIIAIASLHPTDSILRIHCQGGNAIGGYVHDTLNDCYCARGVDYCVLGYVPIVVQLTMDEMWSTYVPIPEIVMRRYMTRRQKNNLKAFQDHYKDHRIYFLQLVD